jgi:hypothetical protein
VTFLGAVLSALLAVPDTGLSDISTAGWFSIALATIVAAGGVLGLQAAPATIATSTK